MKFGDTSCIIFLLVSLVGCQYVLANNQEPQAFQQETVAPSPAPKKTSSCKKVKVNDVKLRLKAMRNEVIGGRGYSNQQPTRENCSEDGDGTVSEPVAYDYWKVNIIMASTVTAAVEFVLIILIVIYWRQIRWTLRKITCPCDNRRNSHEAMEPEAEEETHDLSSVELHITPRLSRPRESRRSHPTNSTQPSQQRAGSEVQMYTSPRWSRVQSATDDLDSDLAVPGPSGLNPQCMTRSPFRTMVHTYSSSDESLDSIPVPSLPNPGSRQTGPAPISPAKGSSKRRTKGSKGKSVGSSHRQGQYAAAGSEECEALCEKAKSDSAELTDILCQDAGPSQTVSLSLKVPESEMYHAQRSQDQAGVGTCEVSDGGPRQQTLISMGDDQSGLSGTDSESSRLMVETTAEVHCDSSSSSPPHRS